MHRLLQDLHFALRQLKKTPGFTLVAVLTLGLGIGATTALFSVVYGVLVRALPYPQPERIVRVFEVGANGSRANQMADLNFADFSEQSRSFEALAQFQTMLVSVSGSGTPARVVAGQVSRGFFEVMGVEPYLGRPFRPEEQREGASRVAIVGHDYWRQHLQGDPHLSGSTVRYGDDLFSVVGVMPPGFDFPDGASLWIPRELEPLNLSRTALNKKVIGRLAADVPLQLVRQDVSNIARRLKAQYGEDIWMSDAAVVPLHEELVGHTRPPLLLLLASSGLLLLIACANVVNLLLARMTSRRHELAVRVALGAGRVRLSRQSLTESLLLSLLGATVGIFIARWSLDLLRGLEAGKLPRLGEIQVDGTALLFALALSVAVAAGLSLLASWPADGAGVRASLAAGQKTHTGKGTNRLRGMLVVSEVALTLVLLAGTGLLLRSFQRLLATEPGYRTEGAVTLNCYLPYPENDEQAELQRRFHARLMSRLGDQPGVVRVGAIDALPLKGRGPSGTFLLLEHPDEVTDWESFDAMAKDPERSGYAQYRKATVGYFEAMRIPLLRGRTFDRRDQPDAPHVALVSESLAESAWPGEDAIGKLVQFGNMDGDLRPFTIVGIVGDIREASLDAEPQPTLYANSWQRSWGLAGPLDIVLVTADETADVVTGFRRLVYDVDPQVAPNVQPIEGVFAESLAERRFQLLLLAVFGTTALLLAVVGIYGVISFHVTQRTQEIAVRVALGATSGKVVELVLRQGLGLIALGVAIGLAGAFAATRLMQGLVFGIHTSDPVTFLSVPVLLGVAALLACFLPAYRATCVDPALALRTE